MGRWAVEGREAIWRSDGGAGAERKGPGNETMSAPPVTKQKVTDAQRFFSLKWGIGATSTTEKAVKVAEH